ncbi:YiiX/YebB-like N1pC/P60 family cysteine hydrolase [Hyphomicrobium sp. CS1GBMeth3]|uniref:YiiX/YebB-like N1pC/P60 family cysteine hydrolase n=1 Tax=Hyphomicrobium sp. CS1GBMeth3 TaxID=1892845 RepID=UPI00093161A6|nr:YiiX/YebB-like N1pC/P60 family cysteine hydrolase [Hyphomicrobium sp. CS1GBMeth3]
MRYAIQAVAALLALTGVGLTLAPAEGLPPLRTGDIVFQKTITNASDAIMLASDTQYTHVGIVEVDKRGRQLVIEAVGPVQAVPLEDWVGKGEGNKITVKRLKDLDDAQAKQAVANARRYLGRPYDHFFYESRDQIYCSELVYLAFKDGPGITVGREEKVRDLNIDTGAAQKLIRQRWKAHPLCKAKSAKSFDACYDLILEQTLVTPASIARDPRMELVFTSFGSDAE